ncbi:granzyme B-like isoform X2 [Pygocentrus nattereri]|uniref:granzyme B-like isoform X2 n=1 Tax=Pygocentrus nattereri TaxID=42514 RepID=UPI0008149EAE|nr:granzyme B-like isoform X2 [Pygocentrus nattereri]
MLLHISALLYFLTLSRAMDSGIVGGKEAKPHSRPYMVSVQHNGRHTCGGILIRKDFVLTAAHCLKADLEVVLGAHNIKKTEPNQQRIQVRNSIRHPNYNKYTTAGNWENLTVDIMLLKLKSNAKLNKFVKVMKLPGKKDKTSVKCNIAGWGMRQPNSMESNVLIETSLTVLPQPECKEIWQIYYDSNCMMCTATAEDNTFCQGDSGGPLICKSKLQGLAIYTFRERCNDPRYPGVSLKISTFLDWIKKVMGKEI